MNLSPRPHRLAVSRSVLISRYLSSLVLICAVLSTTATAFAQHETEPNDTTPNKAFGEMSLRLTGVLTEPTLKGGIGDTDIWEYFAYSTNGPLPPYLVRVNVVPPSAPATITIQVSGTGPGGAWSTSFYDFTEPIEFRHFVGFHDLPHTLKLQTVGSEQDLHYTVDIISEGAIVAGTAPGSTQENPELPDRIDFPTPPPGGFPPLPGGGSSAPPPTMVFEDVPTGAWVDPPSVWGFEYEMTGSSLFTSILDFPVGFADPFTVEANGTTIGTFTPGQSVDFVSALGGGVSSFRVTGINPLVDSENPVAFPLKLAFDTPTADFTMTGIQPNTLAAAPEPASVGLLLLGVVAGGCIARRNRASSHVRQDAHP